MATATIYPHISKIDDTPARLSRLPRVRVSQVVAAYLNHGWSADEICIHFPHLQQAEVHAAMTYYFDHRAEIAKELSDEQALIETWRQNTPQTDIERRLRAEGLLPSQTQELQTQTGDA